MSDKPYNNEGKIAVFPNNKGDNPKRPDYRGTAQINGVTYELSMWARTSQKTGGEYWSGDIKPQQPKQAAPQPAPQPKPAPTSQPKPAQKLDEDVPF